MLRAQSSFSRRIVLAACLLGGSLFEFGAQDADAAGPLDCSSNYQVRQEFANGAEWELCWEERTAEGILLEDVHYTTASGIRRKVFYRAGVAQIHVPYDDNGARYHDVSDYALGGSNLNDLKAADCPNGVRRYHNGDAAICKTLHSNHLSSATDHHARHGESLSLFSVSHVGQYNYIPMWVFFDDGTIEVSMGATGKLQRYTNLPEHGWPVNQSSNPVGVSHLHNYYWRLDFELAADGDDSEYVDAVEQIEFIAEDGTNQTRAKVITQFDFETATSINSETKRFWRIKDHALTNTEGAPISYDIVMLETGHRDEGPSFEPFTFHDLYVTKWRSCEKWASHNPQASGCSKDGDVSSFVNGESLVDEDVVVWLGISFHHIPRDEDEPYMHAHWNRFQIAPRDWTAGAVPTDFDGDGIPDSSDPDDDNDGMSDEFEIEYQLNPFDASDAQLDPDGDGLTNLEEFNRNPSTNPNNPDTDGDGIGDALDNLASTPSNGCTGGDLYDRTLETVISAGVTCAARRTVTVHPPTEVQESGQLYLVAPTVIFRSGFRAGALSVVAADACPGCVL